MHVGNAVWFPCKNSVLFGLLVTPVSRVHFLEGKFLDPLNMTPKKNPGWWNILFHPYEMLWYQSAKMHMIIFLVLVVSNMFFQCSSLFGEDEPISTSIFFRGVESWNHQAVLSEPTSWVFQTFRCSPVNSSHFTKVDKSSGCLVTPQETEKMTTWGGWRNFSSVEICSSSICWIQLWNLEPILF